MIFGKNQIGKIARGEITQVRIRASGTEPRYTQPRTRAGHRKLKSGPSMVLVQPFRPQPGDRWSVRPERGKPAELHIIATDVLLTTAGTLTFADARAMGYATTSEAMAAWLSSNDQGWVCEEQPCQACGGPGVVDDFCVTCGCDDQAAARFVRRHVDRLIWAITFRVDIEDHGRWMAGRYTEADYVGGPARALSEEQAVTATDQAAITDRADTELAQWKALEERTRSRDMEMLGCERRLQTLRNAASASRASVQRELWMVDRFIQEGRPQHAIHHRLEIAERKMLREAA